MLLYTFPILFDTNRIRYKQNSPMSYHLSKVLYCFSPLRSTSFLFFSNTNLDVTNQHCSNTLRDESQPIISNAAHVSAFPSFSNTNGYITNDHRSKSVPYSTILYLASPSPIIANPRCSIPFLTFP